VYLGDQMLTAPPRVADEISRCVQALERPSAMMSRSGSRRHERQTRKAGEALRHRDLAVADRGGDAELHE
jgi:hypothetical protein